RAPSGQLRVGFSASSSRRGAGSTSQGPPLFLVTAHSKVLTARNRATAHFKGLRPKGGSSRRVLGEAASSGSEWREKGEEEVPEGVTNGGEGPQVWQTKGLQEGVFGSVAMIRLTGCFF